MKEGIALYAGAVLIVTISIISVTTIFSNTLISDM